MKKILMICSVAMSVMLMVVMLSGCESADGYSIEVNASSYSVGNGGTVYLSASGWDDYTWSLSDNSLGYLNKLNGSSVIYTSRAASGTQKITIVARGSGAVAEIPTDNNSSNKTQKVTSSPLVRTIAITHK